MLVLEQKSYVMRTIALEETSDEEPSILIMEQTNTLSIFLVLFEIWTSTHKVVIKKSSVLMFAASGMAMHKWMLPLFGRSAVTCKAYKKNN
jgi:hypothetical protein